MQQVVIRYNPYKMETELTIDGINVAGAQDYSEISSFIENKIPLQTWIEPISHTKWAGILAALKSDDCEASINFEFYGRQMDFDDFCTACKEQNKKREYELKLTFRLHEIRSDVETSKNIENVKNILLSKEFAEIMEEYPADSTAVTEYKLVEEKYNRAKDKEFRVVFAGLYSSGKSLIINTLIRHDILPVSDQTCTSKVCRIVHDGSLSDTVTLECFDKNGNSVIELHTFDSDEACLKFFNSIVPLDESETKLPEFDIVEIHVNLSHLYPSAEMESEFNLTIVDTPGTNSSKTRGASDNIYDNLDRQITIDAITDKNKDMVIICVDAQNYENESLGDLLREIQEVSEEDKGSFSDRFLFVVNKCDLLKYGEGENVERHKNRFSNYLMDKKRWGIKESDCSVEFIPKIFTTSAYIEYAIQKGAAKFKESDFQDKEKRLMNRQYSSYEAEVIKYKDSDHMLLQACDISLSRKTELTEKFDKLAADGAFSEAVSIQTGIPCIESTIRDYIERYAFPFKVRDLLESFEILLKAVNADIDYQENQLKEFDEKLGKIGLDGKEEEEKKNKAKNKKEKKLKIKDSIDKAKQKIESVRIDGRLMLIAQDFDTEFESNEKIAWVRKHHAEPQTKERIDSMFNAIKNIMPELCDDAVAKFTEFEQHYKNYITEILNDLKSVCEGNFENDGYSFQNTITFSKIKDMDIHKLRGDINITKRTEKVSRQNPVKKQVYKKYQIFKRLKQWLAPEEIEVAQNFYSMEPLSRFLNEKLYEFRSLCEETEKVYSADLNLIKNRAVEKIDNFSREIDEMESRINEHETRLLELRTDRSKLNSEINRLQKHSELLHELRNELSFGGENNEL